jgi:hypothetical protein
MHCPTGKLSPEEEQSFGNFSVGSQVEYFSTSQKTWISAHVVKHRADGSYNLDCKPGLVPAVPPERIRSVLSQSHAENSDGISSSFVNLWKAEMQPVDTGKENRKEQQDQHSACAELLSELRQDTLKRLQQVRSELPMSQKKFRRVLEDEKQRAKEQWSMRAIGPEAVHHEYYKELMSAIVDEELALARCNERKADIHLNEAVNKPKRPSKEVQVIEARHCACNAVPMLGFRRFLQSKSASQKASKTKAVLL